MKWFKSKTRNEIEELKAKVESLRSKLDNQTEIRFGHYNMFGYDDLRPKVDLKEVVLLLVEHLNLEIERTETIPARTVLNSPSARPKSPKRRRQK